MIIQFIITVQLLIIVQSPNDDIIFNNDTIYNDNIISNNVSMSNNLAISNNSAEILKLKLM